MNRILLTFIIAGILLSSCRNETVEITGILKNPKNGYIFLDELVSDNLVTVDSVLISEDGTFSLSWKVKSTSFYLLRINDNNFLTMLLEPGEIIEIIANHDSLNFPEIIKGSEGTLLMVQFNRKLMETVDHLKDLGDIYLQNVGTPQLPVVMERLDSLANIHLNEINSYAKKYIDDNLNSLVSLVALYQQVAPGEYILNQDKDFSYFYKVDSVLFGLYPDYEPVQTLHEQVKDMSINISAQKMIMPGIHGGTEAPDIALPNPDGDTIRLSSTRGSVVLLDFWASWCSPCRQENPNLLKAYDQYHSRGFQIYQVSLDKTKEAWLKGISDDRLGKWIHVSDIKYWNSVVVPLYNLESIPANYLLDREGRILATDLRGEMLQKKLAELFD